VFVLEGERLTKDPLSEVIRVERNGGRYYVKRYSGAGKGLRRYLGRPRVKAEWQNLMLFRRWGIPTAPIVAYGMERRGGAFLRGALITRELEQTDDLALLATTHDARLRDPRWVQEVSLQLARSTRAMHDRSFAHNDLKWRNLLVDPQRRLYLIDCPTGASGMVRFCSGVSSRTWHVWTRWPSTSSAEPSACGSICSIASESDWLTRTSRASGRF